MWTGPHEQAVNRRHLHRGPGMIPKPAQYLLRFDDLCPTMAHDRWRRFESLIAEFRIRPILAVVPENRDTELEFSAPDPAFWERMRTLEARGAAIALHGCRHLCRSQGGSLVPLHRNTEFASVDLATQRAWISEGLGILRGHGLNPMLWAAPRHGFDRNTLEALRAEGITALSDGLARAPVLRGGVTWIPQQLWEPAEKSRGLWTICIHPNTPHHGLFAGLRGFLSDHAAQFTSVDRVLAEFDGAPPRLAERAYEQLALSKARFRHFRRV